jgi:formate-nitrite transporter family protein
MSAPLTPVEIFKKAADEGRRRLDQGTIELVATAFIAGFTIVFGVIGLAIGDGLVRPALGDSARLVGALVFGVGLVFLVVGRAELFSENFFDPLAAAFEKERWRMAPRLGRLWVVTLALNLVGAALLVLPLSVEGALPHGAADSLSRMAEEIAERTPVATFVRSIVGGALVALLSFFVAASDDSVARMAVAYMVGVLLALGPFDHVVVTAIHLGFGHVTGAELDASGSMARVAIALAGNLLGGVGLVTLSHAAQAKAGEHKT